MKTYKLKQILTRGDNYLRGTVINIENADDRYFLITIRYKTVPDRQVFVWFD